MIATNTTLDHSAVGGEPDESGGLSGQPLHSRARAVVRFLRKETALPIIGVGGIADRASAEKMVEAGAQLLQIYTGFIYRGPGLLREIAPIR